MTRLTENELAERWQMTTRTLQGWRKTGKGAPFIRIGERSIFYRLEDVLAYEEACVVGKPDAEPAGWRDGLKRAAGALDLLARQKTGKAAATLTGLRDELRTLLTKREQQ